METQKYTLVDSVDALMDKIREVRRAQAKFAEYSQEQVDKIFRAAAVAANQALLKIRSSKTTTPPSISIMPTKTPRPAAL